MSRKSLLFILLLFVFLLSCSNSNRKKTSNKQTRIATVHPVTQSYPKGSIPFTIVSNRMILKMFFNDSIPVHLAFDSGWGPGAGKLTLSSAFVKNHLGKVHLLTTNGMKMSAGSEHGSIMYLDYSDKTLTLFKGKLKEKIGGFEIYDDTLYISGTNHDGIINLMDLKAVKENILEINFEKKYLRIINRSKFSIPKYYRKVRMKFVSNGKVLFANLPFYLLDCTGDTIDLSGDYLFDTGNPDGLILTGRKKMFRNFMNSLGGKRPSNRIDFNSYLYGKTFSSSLYKFKNYSVFGNNIFTNSDIFIYKTNLFPSDKFLYDGILPMNVIKNFNYYFDLKNKVAYIKKIPVKELDIELCTWGFRRNKSKYIVRILKKNSEIDKAGILCGDTVLSINNYPLSHYNRDSLRHLKFRQHNLVIKYKRKNDTLSTVLHLN